MFLDNWFCWNPTGCFYDISGNWAVQLQFFTHSDFFELFLHSQITPYETVPHPKSPTLLNLPSKLIRDNRRSRESAYCSNSRDQSLFKLTEINWFIRATLLTPASRSLCFIKTAKLIISYKIHQFAPLKLKPLSHLLQDTRISDKPLALISFVLHRNFSAFRCGTKIKSLISVPSDVNTSLPTSLMILPIIREAFCFSSETSFHTHC